MMCTILKSMTTSNVSGSSQCFAFISRFVSASDFNEPQYSCIIFLYYVLAVPQHRNWN